MKAVILAAGKGTRMKELTNEVPKPMLRVQGKPILEQIVQGLLSAGIGEICIITGWRAEVIESYFGDGSRSGAKIGYARQLVQDGTGKAPSWPGGSLGAMISCSPMAIYWFSRKPINKCSAALDKATSPGCSPSPKART